MWSEAVSKYFKLIKALTDDEVRRALSYGAIVGMMGSRLAIKFGPPDDRITREGFDLVLLNFYAPEEFIDIWLSPRAGEDDRDDDEDGFIYIYPARLTDVCVGVARTLLIESECPVEALQSYISNQGK